MMRGQGQAYLNSGGFEKWNSWHMNMESPSVRRTKESKQQHFEGFTFELQDYEMEVRQQEEELSDNKEPMPGLE